MLDLSPNTWGTLLYCQRISDDVHVHRLISIKNQPALTPEAAVVELVVDVVPS